jgi:hypothetical protein
VTLKRLPRPVADLLRSYKVIIDGTFVGAIRRRQTRSFDVSPGQHEIHLTIDWCRSRSIQLELLPGEEAHLSCKARSLFGGRGVAHPDDYIMVDVAEPGPGSG